MVGSYSTKILVSSLFIITLSLSPACLLAQNFVGSFTDPLVANTLDVHVVKFQGTLYGVFTDRRSTGECRRLEAVRMVNELISPFQLCALYEPNALNVWFDVEAINSEGAWTQIGVLDMCRAGGTQEQYSHQLAYVGFNQVTVAIRNTQAMDLNGFLSLPICQEK